MSKKTLLLEIITLTGCLFLVAYIVVATKHVNASDAQDTIRVHDMEIVLQAINDYHKDYGYYPPVVGDVPALSKGSVTCSDGTHGTASWCGLIASLRPYLTEQVVDPVSEDIYSYYYNAPGDQPRYFGLMTMLESLRNTSLSDGDYGQFCTTCAAGKRYRGYELGTLPQYCAENNSDRSWTTARDGDQCGL